MGRFPASDCRQRCTLSDRPCRIVVGGHPAQPTDRLAQWHINQGFPDPTKTPVVRKVVRGTQALHPAQEKQAKPLQLEQLDRLTQSLRNAIAAAGTAGDRPNLLQHLRNEGLLLLGFWRGFRGDEQTRLGVEHVTAMSGEGKTCFLTHTKAETIIRKARPSRRLPWRDCARRSIPELDYCQRPDRRSGLPVDEATSERTAFISTASSRCRAMR